MPSFLIYTLGCKLNILESESITESFINAGFCHYNSDIHSHPSIILVNTCTVTSKSDQKSRRVIRKALRDYPDSFVLVTGCYAQLDKEKIEELETDNKERLVVLRAADKNILLDLSKELTQKVNSADAPHRIINKMFADTACSSTVSASFQFSPERFSNHTRSFLKIQDGCDNQCAYCRIRLARGKSVSLACEKVLERLLILEENHAEAVITGANISQYNDSTCKNLSELLQYLLAGTSKIALRLSSLAPDKIDSELAKVLTDKRIRPHFHLSLQSGSKKILEKMGRGYNAQIIKESAGLLRSAKDDPFLACDIITGFPGETETEFNETFDLCCNIGFAWIHVFPFSKRPGTPAWSFLDTVHDTEINRRVKIMTNLAWKGRTDYVNRWIGKEVDIIVENKNISNYCKSGAAVSGISENYLKVLILNNIKKNLQPGIVLRRKLDYLSYDLMKINLKNDYDVMAIADK